MSRSLSPVLSPVGATVLLWGLLSGSMVVGLAEEAKEASGVSFHPRSLDHLELYLESIQGLAIATNDSPEAYEATGENTTLPDLWSDPKRFPHGTVRWWEDQSAYENDRPIRPSRTFNTGRDLGQDDHDRPGYLPEGCHGKPCVRGGLMGTPEGEKHNQQPCYFELQLESRDLKIEGSFSLFLLLRPREQENNAAILGVYHRSVLIQDVSQDCLAWKNQGRPVVLSGPGSLAPGRWQLVELHRGADCSLKCVIAGRDVTVGNPRDDLPFEFMFLFNHNKGQGFAGQDPFTGDIAALAIYRTELSEPDRKRVRDYLGRVYDLEK